MSWARALKHVMPASELGSNCDAHTRHCCYRTALGLCLRAGCALHAPFACATCAASTSALNGSPVLLLQWPVSSPGVVERHATSLPNDTQPDTMQQQPARHQRSISLDARPSTACGVVFQDSQFCLDGFEESLCDVWLGIAPSAPPLRTFRSSLGSSKPLQPTHAPTSTGLHSQQHQATATPASHSPSKPNTGFMTPDSMRPQHSKGTPSFAEFVETLRQRSKQQQQGSAGSWHMASNAGWYFTKGGCSWVQHGQQGGAAGSTGGTPPASSTAGVAAGPLLRQGSPTGGAAPSHADSVVAHTPGPAGKPPIGPQPVPTTATAHTQRPWRSPWLHHKGGERLSSSFNERSQAHPAAGLPHPALGSISARSSLQGHAIPLQRSSTSSLSTRAGPKSHQGPYDGHGPQLGTLT